MIITDNVSDFKVINDSLFTLHGKITSRSLIQWKGDRKSILLENELIASIVNENSVLFAYSKNKCYQWDTALNTRGVYHKFAPFYIIGHLVLGNEEHEEKTILCAYEIGSNIKKWSKDYYTTIYHISSEHIFTVRFTDQLLKLRLECLSLESGKEIWNYQLSENYRWKDASGESHTGEYYKLIGLSNNIFWCVLNSGVIIGLNIETGQVEYELCHPIIYPHSKIINEGFEKVNIFNRHSIMSEDRSEILGMQGHFYWEINLENPVEEFTIYSIKDSCEEHHISLNDTFCLNDNEVYFYEGGYSNRFGIFCRNKKAIIWSSDLPEVKGKFPAIRKMDYTNYRIYIQDFYNSLHVIEKPKST